jgi:hypothetical protein
MRKYAKIFDNTFLESELTILSPVKTQSATSSVGTTISHYALGETIACSIAPRTRREAQLFKSEINDVQGEMQIIISLEDRDKISDDHCVRMVEADYSVRFDVNEDNKMEVFLYLIAEKRSSRAKVV